jgi:hypothetical protein
MRAIVLTVLLGLLGYALVMIGVRGSSPHGGLEWGARFALPFYALLALVAAWNPSAHRIDRAIIGLLVCLGIGFQVRGILTIRHDKQINAALNQAILDTPEKDIVTDLWWLPSNAAPIYPRKAFYAAGTPWEIAAWANRASSQGVGQFNLVTLDYALPAKVKGHLPGYELTILELIQVKNLLIFRIAVEPDRKANWGAQVISNSPPLY